MKRVAALIASLLLVALPATAEEPRGTVTLVVAWSNGTTQVPVAAGTLPLICEPAP